MRIESMNVENIEPDFSMTPDEVTKFLQEVRYAAVTSLRRDGSPISIVVGYEWDGLHLYFSVRNTRLIIQRLNHDQRLSVAIFNETHPHKFVILQGSANQIEDPNFERTWRMFEKYMNPNSDRMKIENIDLKAFKAAYVDAGRTLYQVTVSKLITEDATKMYEAGQLGGAGVSDVRARRRSALDEGSK